MNSITIKGKTWDLTDQDVVILLNATNQVQAQGPANIIAAGSFAVKVMEMAQVAQAEEVVVPENYKPTPRKRARKPKRETK